MAPGSGTEVFGDEGELRRMLHVLIGHGTGSGSNVTVKRDGDDVRISVTLGPDSSTIAETERAWLSRMAIRYGGKHELEGGTESISLSADGVSERNEREALRKELDEARRQGEAYARELAAAYALGEELASPSTFPPAPGADRLAIVASLSGAVASELRAMLFPAVKELAALRRPGETEEALDGVRRRLAHVQDFLAGLAGIGELDANELPGEVDLADVARQAIRQQSPRAERAAVTLKLVTSPDEVDARAYARCAPRAGAALVRELIAQAIGASPHGSSVTVTVSAAGHGDAATRGPRLTVDDAGAPLPAHARRAFLGLELDPGTLGRPSSLPLYVCSEIASAQNALLELSDAPAHHPQGDGGGLRVTVTFPR
jgi:signal transduction histidine kinase